MTYSTVTEFKDRVPQHDLQLLTEVDSGVGIINESRLIDALNDATAEINGYIAKAVTLPLINPPAMLGTVCRDLAMHRLYANIGRVTETQDKLRDAAISYLEMVRDGEVSIGDETATDTVNSSGGAVSVEGPDRVMTRDNLRSY